MGNPELQGRLGRQVASAFHCMEGSRIFLKALGASSSRERRFAHHVDKMSDICASTSTSELHSGEPLGAPKQWASERLGTSFSQGHMCGSFGLLVMQHRGSLGSVIKYKGELHHNGPYMGSDHLGSPRLHHLISPFCASVSSV